MKFFESKFRQFAQKREKGERKDAPKRASGLILFAGWAFSQGCNAFLSVVAIFLAVVWTFGKDLPNYTQLARYEPPIISRVFSAEGELIDEFAKERRLFSPIEEIPSLVKNAVISAEDKNFYSHKGYDAIGMAKAAVDAARGGKLRGASTITQQVMKNFLLSGERSFDRKIKEIILAARLERTLSKDQILELYLNEIFLGQNSYGVVAAAQTYFNKTLEELTPGEAAYLAALPKAPSNYHPVREVSRAIGRRNFVLREMEENGYISEAVRAAESGAELRTVLNGDYESFRSSLPPRGYFTDEIRRQLAGSFGEDAFFSGGLNIRATVDRELQDLAAAALRRGLEEYDRNKGLWRGTGLKLAQEHLTDEATWREELSKTRLPRDIRGWHPAVVLELRGGDAVVGIEGRELDETSVIRAEDVAWAKRRATEDGRTASVDGSLGGLVGVGDVVHVTPLSGNEGRIVGWSLRQVPEVQGAFMAMDPNTGRVLAMQGGFTYQGSVFNRTTQATRQPGSAFKPFVYAAALDSGYTPATILIDAPIEIETVEGIWRPSNSNDTFYGPVPLRTGIEYSRNLMTIRLAKDVGMENVAFYAENFGIYDEMADYLANSLGSQETTLYHMVAGYAMFANGGERVEPTLVDRVQDRWGRTIYRHDKRDCIDCGNRFLQPNSAPEIQSDRMRVIDAVTAYQITFMMEGVVERGTGRHHIDLEVPVAGKTGTTNESRDAWFIGYTPNIVAGCYIGYDLPRSLGKRAYGGTLCGPVFNDFMERAIERYGSESFKVPDNGVFVNIDKETGERIANDPDGTRSIMEFFRIGTEPVKGEYRIVDGGYAMGSDLFSNEDNAGGAQTGLQNEASQDDPGSPQSLLGDPERSSFGSLSSGGLY